MLLIRVLSPWYTSHEERWNQAEGPQTSTVFLYLKSQSIWSWDLYDSVVGSCLIDFQTFKREGRYGWEPFLLALLISWIIWSCFKMQSHKRLAVRFLRHEIENRLRAVYPSPHFQTISYFDETCCFIAIVSVCWNGKLPESFFEKWTQSASAFDFQQNLNWQKSLRYKKLYPTPTRLGKFK